MTLIVSSRLARLIGTPITWASPVLEVLVEVRVFVPLVGIDVLVPLVGAVQ